MKRVFAVSFLIDSLPVQASYGIQSCYHCVVLYSYRLLCLNKFKYILLICSVLCIKQCAKCWSVVQLFGVRLSKGSCEDVTVSSCDAWTDPVLAVGRKPACDWPRSLRCIIILGFPINTSFLSYQGGMPCCRLSALIWNVLVFGFVCASCFTYLKNWSITYSYYL